jgi:hypothetical protein
MMRLAGIYDLDCRLLPRKGSSPKAETLQGLGAESLRAQSGARAGCAQPLLDDIEMPQQARRSLGNDDDFADLAVAVEILIRVFDM